MYGDGRHPAKDNEVIMKDSKRDRAEVKTILYNRHQMREGGRRMQRRLNFEPPYLNWEFGTDLEFESQEPQKSQNFVLPNILYHTLHVKLFSKS